MCIPRIHLIGNTRSAIPTTSVYPTEKKPTIIEQAAGKPVNTQAFRVVNRVFPSFGRIHAVEAHPWRVLMLDECRLTKLIAGALAD